MPAAELLPPNPDGRRFRAERTVRLGDVDPNGELRLDATARYLQDVATDDALDAGLDNALGWVVRRTMIRVDQPAMMSERLVLTTFCTGAGRSWAERRTSIVRNRLRLAPEEFAQSPVHALRTLRRVAVGTALAVTVEEDRWAKAKASARGLLPSRQR